MPDAFSSLVLDVPALQRKHRSASFVLDVPASLSRDGFASWCTDVRTSSVQAKPVLLFMRTVHVGAFLAIPARGPKRRLK